jgi:hypothetical protein
MVKPLPYYIAPAKIVAITAAAMIDIPRIVAEMITVMNIGKPSFCMIAPPSLTIFLP